MEATGLHPDFGVEVHAVDLLDVNEKVLYPEIRDLFEQHSLLLFRDQKLDENQHRALALLFGPLEDLRDTEEGKPPIRPILTNLSDEGGLAGESDLQVLDLKSNFFWHTDSTFLPTPAISNILVACTIPSSGGDTEFVSTRVGWARLPEKLKQKARGKVFLHRWAQSRKLVDNTLSEQRMYTKFPDTPWRSTWRNPTNGMEALYIAAHAFGVLGMSEEKGMELINDLISAVTQREAVYAHKWRVGDVLIWDERATLHRGTPWAYDEARTLASFVSSASESDGIGSARP